MITVSQTGKADYKTVQAAIDAAPPKSRIEILDRGPYNEPIVIAKEKAGLTLSGGKGVYAVLASVGAKTFPVIVTVHTPGFRLEQAAMIHDHTIGGWCGQRRQR